MNKVMIILLCVAIVVGAIITAVVIYDNNKQIKDEEHIVTEISEKITDDCTEEYEEIEQQKMLQANSSKERISPNCLITLKKYYKKCEHTINEYVSVPDKLVNKTQEDLQEEYEGWEIKEFSANKIILYKEFEEECNEHYIVKDNDGKVKIYKILENGEQVEEKATEISTDYLTENDKLNMKNGIIVNSKEDLNQLIEDFE